VFGSALNFRFGKCPKSTNAGEFVYYTEGVPAGGGQISDLWAEASGPIASGKATVNVLDMTPPEGPQTVAMSCEVTVGQSTCSNTGSVPIAAGHYMLVQIITTAKPTRWDVTFRY